MLTIFPKAFSLGFSPKGTGTSSGSSDHKNESVNQGVPWFVQGESQTITMIQDGLKLKEHKPS